MFTRRALAVFGSLLLTGLLLVDSTAEAARIRQRLRLTLSAETTSGVIITAPSPASGTVSIRAEIGTRLYKFLTINLNGTEIARCQTSTCVASWNTRLGPNGTHSLTAKNIDPRKRVRESASVSVIVDNDLTPPYVSLNAPSTATGPVTLSAEASDTGGVSALTILVDGTPLQATSMLAAAAVASTTSSTSATWDTSTASAGSHTVQAMATDQSGNVGSSVPTTVVVGTDAPPSASLDPYGGYTNLPVPGGATGYFRTGKLGNRWVLATPDGNAFWLRGVYHVDVPTSTDDLGSNYQSRARAKYGDSDLTWGPQQVRRLRSWGFNTIAEYSNKWTLPSTTDSRWPAGQQPEKMPAIGFIRSSYYALRNLNNWASGPVKELIGPTDAHYTGYRPFGAGFPDIYDSRFIEWLTGALQYSSAAPLLQSPWAIGLTVDDTDDLYGFGAGPDFAQVTQGRVNPHLGWIVLVTPPTQSSNTRIGVTYTDTTVYSKLALRDFLQAKYGTIVALNAAWGSTYTTWDSDGGWPTGNGFLDENGKGSWTGTHLLQNTAPQVVVDLDAFLEVFARHYFQSVRAAIQARYPNLPYLGPTTLGSWDAPSRKEILKAAGTFVDVVQANLYTPYLQAQIDFITTHAGDKPILTWEGGAANADSAFWRYNNTAGQKYQTQVQRGQVYQQILTAYLTTASTVTGSFPLVGIKWWEFADNWSEKVNWGLVTLSDNAYDGLEAGQAAGQDAWGYATGGEGRKYGDVLSAVKRANASVIKHLINVKNGNS